MNTADASPEAGADTPLRIGILGAGMIATCPWGVLPFVPSLHPRVRIESIAANRQENAAAVASRFGIPRSFGSLREMLDAGGIDAVVNLTPIPVHAETSTQILEAGLHLITEKPLAGTIGEADQLIMLARERGLQIVCSPPSAIEPSRVLARQLVEGGAIGPVAFARVRSSHAGPAWNAWPADPTWFYADGSGPLLDMGVYGIQQITAVLGPARRVMAMSGKTASERTAAGGAFDGRVIPVESDDNVLLMLDFGDSVFTTIDATFNVRATLAPEVEIYGHNGTIVLNAWDSPRPSIELYQVGPDGVAGEWVEVVSDRMRTVEARNATLQRAILIDHLEESLREDRPSRLTGEHARHTLEVMLAARRSAVEGRAIDLLTSF